MHSRRRFLAAVGATALVASRADVRFERILEQQIYTRDEHLAHAGDSQSMGVGIRVIL